MDKCLKNALFDLWIRRANKFRKEVSNIWCFLVSSFNILGDWLAWIPGNGTNIRIGMDLIVGGPSTYGLSYDLLHIICCEYLIKYY